MNTLYQKYKEIINYLIVGVLTTFVSLATYYICVIFFFDPQSPIQLQLSNIISWIAAVSFAYITNRIFVFSSHNTNIIKEIASFTGSRLFTLFLDMLIMFIGVTILHGNDKIIKLLVQVIVTVSNYILSKFLVFKKHN